MARLDAYKPWSLVTGASSGIGESFVRALAREGFHVFMVARRKDRLKKIQEELASLPVEIDFCVADLTKMEDVNRVYHEFKSRPRELGLLINNAGMGKFGEFNLTSQEDLACMIDLNCRAVVQLTRLFSPTLSQRKRSAVVFVSSVVARLPSPLFSVYSATKAFELILAEALSAEWQSQNIDVLNLMPGLTRSEFHEIAGLNTAAVPVPYRDCDQVVETALRSLGKKCSVIDGIWNRIGLGLAALIPMPCLSRIIFYQSQKRLRGKKA